MPLTFTPLGGGLGGELGGGENTLFGSQDLDGGANPVSAPLFAGLGGSLKSGPG